nr:6-phosphofructo-1-kinase=phosphorylation site [Fasciola hepatica=liver fluke, Peptide Partial, 12 aa] [Fasciola hepatica]
RSTMMIPGMEGK